MAVIGVAVDVGKQDAQETLWLDLVTFGGIAEKLCSITGNQAWYRQQDASH